jgi:hypothetical protein
MPFRRTIVAAVMTLMLGGTLLPIDRSDAQIGQPATYPSETDRQPTPVGLLGLIGLVGLLGLFGGRKEQSLV